MKSSKYWEQTALLREIAVQEGATATTKELLRLYNEALEDINDEIRKIKYNMAKRYGIDEDTAERYITSAMREDNLNTLIELMDKAPDAAKRAKILDYIHRDGLSVRAYAARTERYRQVKDAIYIRIMKLAGHGIGLIEESLKKSYKESYYGAVDDFAQGANVGINFAMLNDRAIHEAVYAKWNGKRFSERIWDNTDMLAKEAQELVVKSLMSGEAIEKTSRKLRDRFNVSTVRAQTLIRTETAHIHAMADLKAYDDIGIKEYKYLATLDYLTCSICQPLDGMVFKREDAKPGVNFPCMHPNCRCTTTPNMDYSSRTSKDPETGRYKNVDGNITYEEWVNSLSSEKKKALELARLKNERKTSDKLQYAKYKKVLGSKVIPKSFDNFQELKYTNTEKWNFIKLDYSRQNRLLQDPMLALPNVDKATVDDRKFTEYLFGGKHENGLAKGQAFTSRLGYDIENYAELKKEILSKTDRYTATHKGKNNYGDLYEQKMVLYGNKNSPANVIVSWCSSENSTWLTSTYIKELKQ